MDIQEYFKTMVEIEASDLYLTVAGRRCIALKARSSPTAINFFTPDEVHALADGDHERKAAARNSPKPWK